MRQIGSYIVEDTPLAKGGMGQIFRGKDSLGNKVAIKEILPEYATDFSIIARIEKEVEFMVKIEHPSIVKLYSAFRDSSNDSYYIVMEMVEGQNLEEYISSNGPMSPEMASQLMIGILDALQCVHNAHIIHRDLKPSNIMIRPDMSVCLLDFGVAKDLVANNGLSVVGSIIGTSGYMSPEQAEGYSIDYRTDIYSLGCVFYYMLTGHHAFNTLSSEIETKDAILTQRFPRLSKYRTGLPEKLQSILDKATERDMMQRYDSCGSFISALRNNTLISRSQDAEVKITVGRQGCDITMNDMAGKISRHHLDIEMKVFTGGTYYVLTDLSTNGTMVGDERIYHKSIHIPANGPLPVVTLANVADGRLDWMEVISLLQGRIGGQVTGGEEFEEKPDSAGQTATGLLIPAYIFLVLGGFLAIILGLHVALTKVPDYDGNKIYKYIKSHRQLGLIAAAASPVSIAIWLLLI